MRKKVLLKRILYNWGISFSQPLVFGGWLKERLKDQEMACEGEDRAEQRGWEEPREARNGGASCVRYQSTLLSFSLTFKQAGLDFLGSSRLYRQSLS